MQGFSKIRSFLSHSMAKIDSQNTKKGGSSQWYDQEKNLCFRSNCQLCGIQCHTAFKVSLSTSEGTLRTF